MNYRFQLNRSLKDRIIRLMENSPYKDVDLSNMINMLMRIGLEVEERVRGIPEEPPLPGWITEILAD